MDGNMADGIPSSSHSMADGIRPDSLVGSPASSSGGAGIGAGAAASRQRQKQVPISRSTASGYERPERARTSHACEPCRERKTKCDGERPSCRRCLHTGTICHYGYGKGWKKRKTAEDLNVTSSKLARYERLLNDIFPLVSTDVRNMIDDVRQQDFTSLSMPNLDHVDSRDSATNALDPDRRRTSPSLHRLPPPPPASVQMSQSTPSFISTPRSLPPPLATDPSQSPLPSTASVQGSSKSPSDDMSISSTIRLPSITRHGFLVEDGSRAQLAQGPGSPVLDGQLSSVPSTDADQPAASTMLTTTAHP